MRCFISAFLAILICIPAPAFAETDEVEAACSSLARPNIDCSCVANRIDKFAAAGGYDAGGKYLVESYKFLLGAEHDILAAQESRMADVNSYMNYSQAMDDLGGEPDEIAEFEKGCVIAGAPVPTLPTIPSGSFLESAVEVCKVSGSGERNCQCMEPRIRNSMSAREYEAMTRDIADWVGLDIKRPGNAGKPHAAIMGLSEDQYSKLVAAAAAKRSNIIDQVTNVCLATVWADEDPGLSTSARSASGFDPGEAEAAIEKANEGPSVMKTESDELVRARTIIKDGCSAQGQSAAYCTCVAKEFDAKIVPQAGTSSKAFGWALLLYGEGALPAADFMNGMMEMSSSGEMEDVAMLMATGPDVEGMCYGQ